MYTHTYVSGNILGIWGIDKDGKFFSQTIELEDLEWRNQ